MSQSQTGGASTNALRKATKIAARAEQTNHTSIVLEVQVDAIWPSPRLALSHNHSGHDLLPQLRLSLLDSRNNHVTDTGGGETIQASASRDDGDDVDVTGTGVVAAVHHGSTNSQSVLLNLSILFPCFLS
jgi:hypothetical protein